MSNQYLSFDVTKQSASQELITGRQGDGQLKNVTMSLWDGEKNVPYDMTGKQLIFEALKPDGSHIIDSAGVRILDAEKGLVAYQFHEQVFTANGDMNQAFFKITHTDSGGNVIADSTLEMSIRILENRVEQHINSEDYLSAYQDLINKLQGLFDSFESTVADNIQQVKDIHDEINNLITQIQNNQVLTGRAAKQGILAPITLVVSDFSADSKPLGYKDATPSGVIVDTENQALILADLAYFNFN